MRRLAIALSLALPCPAAGAIADQDPPIDPAGLLAEGQRILAFGDAEQAARLLDAALDLLPPEDVGLRLAGLVALGAAQSEGGCREPCMAAFAEAIALADRIAADPGAEVPALGIAVRTQLAETLRARGQHADAESVAWDALDVAVSLSSLDSAAAPLRLVLLSAVDQGADGVALADLAVELDLALGSLDAYRMNAAPPPEPISLLLEQAARDLAMAGELALARETFAALAALDEARGAGHRLAGDLGQLGWAALEDGDLRAARWALGLALARDDRSIEVHASLGALAFEEGRSQDAKRHCLRAIDIARQQGDAFRNASLTGRLARLSSASGEMEAAVRLHAEAAALWLGLDRPGDAAMEQALAALALALAGRTEEARRRYQEAADTLGEARMPELVQDVGALVDLARARDGSLVSGEAASLLLEVEQHAFASEEPELLLDAALLHIDLAAEDGADLARTAAAIQDLERAAGLGLEGWWGAWALGVASSGADRIAAWDVAARRQEWLAAHPLPDGRSPGEPGLGQADPVAVHLALLPELLAAARHGEALDIVERWRGFRSLRLRPVAPGDQRIQALRYRLRDVSLRGGDRPPADVRDEIAPAWERLAQEEEQALLPAGEASRLLARPEGPGGWRPPAGTVAVVALPEGGLLVQRETGEVLWLAPAPGGETERAARAWRTATTGRGRGTALVDLAASLASLAPLLAAADGVLWVPDGPLAGVPLAALPLSRGRAVGEGAWVLTFPSLRLAALPRPVPAGPWIAVGKETGEADLALSDGAFVLFDVPCSAAPRVPASWSLGLAADPRSGRATEPPPADGLLQPDEVIAAGWRPSLVVLPFCEAGSVEGEPWTEAWLLGGASAVVRPLWEPRRRARDLFLDRLEREVRAGRTVREAFASALTRVRLRYRDPRDWAAWALSAPVEPARQ